MVRIEAIKELSDIKDKRGIDPLIQMLSDSALEVRKEASIGLVKFGPIAGKQVILAYVEADSLKRRDFIEALPQMIEIIDVPLINLLNSYKSDERRLASAAIIYLQNDLIYEKLINQYHSNTNPSLNLEFINTLSHSEKNNAIDILIYYLTSEKNEFRAAAITAIGRIGGSKSIETLLSFLIVSSHPEEFVNGFEILGVAAIDSMLIIIENNKVYKNDRLGTRIEKCKAKRNTIFILGELKVQKAVVPLISIIKNPDDICVSEASTALGKIGDIKAVPYLLKLTRHHNFIISSSATSALAELNEKRAYAPLLKQTKHFSSSTRLSAIRSLIKLNYPDINNILISSLCDWYISKEVVEILKERGCLPNSNEEKIYFWISQKDFKRLNENWELTKEILLKDINSDNYLAWENAVLTFISLGNQEVIPDLIETLNRLDKPLTPMIPEAYLNCGNELLAEAAKKWAKRNGYTIKDIGGSKIVGWGSFN